MLDDTIVAIATPPGRGGVGVVRVSGPDALRLGRLLSGDARVRALEAPNVASVVDLIDPLAPGEPLDRAVVTTFRAPHSYTGEDVLELSCHGSPLVLEAVLAALLAGGARLASAGEFTLRAFVHRRLDLTQAEAVRDLVDAQTAHQARRAQRQLHGELSKRLAPLKERLLELVVHLESTVEFVEDDIEPATRAALVDELGAASAELASLTASYRLGRLVSEGLSVALVGPPNAGKSSIFNQLLESERAIVTPIPGTTRDLVSERVELGGIPVRLVDTAGLRETHDPVERIGVERTRSALVDADVVLVVVDGPAATTDAVATLLDETEGTRRVVVFNKSDLGEPASGVIALVESHGAPGVRASALTGDGVADVRTAVLERAGGSGLESDGILVTNARHHALLVAASGHLDEAAAAFRNGFGEEVALVGLHAALRDLGELTGETALDDILTRIFSTFCIGK